MTYEMTILRRGLTSLESLDLDGNQLILVPGAALSHLPQECTQTTHCAFSLDFLCSFLSSFLQNVYRLFILLFLPGDKIVIGLLLTSFIFSDLFKI